MMLQQRILAPRFGKRIKARFAIQCAYQRTTRKSSSESNRDRLRTIPVEEVKPPNAAYESWCQGSMTGALEPYYQKKEPAVFRQAVASARAYNNWNDWDYIENIVDINTICHVEVGGNYATSERSDIRFGDYLAYLRFFEEKHGRAVDPQKIPSWPPNQDLVYLAQNDVFAGMGQDFDVPDFCSNAMLGEGRIYNTMIWIGPYGCVSPMHFDPLDNILMQFVGVKHVWLFAPDKPVYAGTEGNQYNTSPINPEQPLDFDQYPLLADALPAFECILRPGDMLFIPKKWYHYVRTVETSVSVNAWWR